MGLGILPALRCSSGREGSRGIVQDLYALVGMMVFGRACEPDLLKRECEVHRDWPFGTAPYDKLDDINS